MMEFINSDVQSVALGLALLPSDDESLSHWHQVCDNTIRTCIVIEVVTREYSYFHENRICGGSSGKNEKDVYPEKGLQLIRVEQGSHDGGRGSSSGWKLYLLESRKLLFVDFEIKSDMTAGWSLGYDEDLYDYHSVQKEMENDLAGLRALFERIEDLRRQVRTKAYRQWEIRQGYTEEYRNWTDDFGDWLMAKRSLDIPDEVWI